MPEPEPAARRAAGPGSTPQSPRTLRWAVGLLLAETAAGGAVVSTLVYHDITTPPTDARLAAWVTGFAVFLSALTGLLAWALGRGRGWARGPAIALQLLLAPVAYSAVTSPQWWLGVPLTVVAAGIVATLLAPATRDWLGREPRS